MAIQNPTKYVTVRRLNRFHQKILAEMPSSTVATDATCIAAAAEIIFTPPVEEEEPVEEP
jgi:hypothetical protein